MLSRWHRENNITLDHWPIRNLEDSDWLPSQSEYSEADHRCAAMWAARCLRWVQRLLAPKKRSAMAPVPAWRATIPMVIGSVGVVSAITPQWGRR